jgi:hypothetical protein
MLNLVPSRKRSRFAARRRPSIRPLLSSFRRDHQLSALVRGRSKKRESLLRWKPLTRETVSRLNPTFCSNDCRTPMTNRRMRCRGKLLHPDPGEACAGAGPANPARPVGPMRCVMRSLPSRPVIPSRSFGEPSSTRGIRLRRPPWRGEVSRSKSGAVNHVFGGVERMD